MTSGHGSLPRIQTLQVGMSWLPEQPGNGLDRVFYSLINNLPSAGVDVTGMVAGTGDVAKSSKNVVTAFESDKARLDRRILAARRRGRELLRAHDFDLVASHFALYTAPLLSMLPSSLPLIVHFHGPWADESREEGDGGILVFAKRFVERKVYARARRFVVLSRAFRDTLTDRFGVSQDDIRVVPGGVDTDRFEVGGSREEARRKLGWPVTGKVVLSVRRLARRMGLENLIDAAQKLRESAPDLAIMIAGKGPIEQELRDRIRGHGLESTVKLLGYVSEADLPYAYLAADFTIVPTVSLEGFGLITIESLSAGTPVLVTPVGGLPETVTGLSEDLVLAGSEVGDIAEGILGAYEGRLPLPTQSQCREYARTNHDWSVIAMKTRSVYEEVLA